MIGEVNRPGDYFATDLAIVPMPKIEVESVGALSFPVPDAQVRELLDAAEQSPFGLGTETIIDPKVRDCKQFEPDMVKISGKTWKKTFGQIFKEAAEGLGCPHDSIRAELYKVLVYDTGGFFSPHRDTEKGDGMVATLVISLPVAGTGGEIVIRHQGHEKVIDMTTDNPSELSWVTFFADCEHEIRPVSSGYRICLVYNLMVKPGKSIPTPPPDYITMVKPVVQELKSIACATSKGNKLVWILEHDYTEAGLSYDTLKNKDAAVGGLLLEAAKKSDYVISTALLEVQDSYNEYDDYYGPSEQHIETTAELSELKAVQKSDVVPKKLHLDQGEMMPSGDYTLGFADEEDYDDPMGNAGATVDRFYHRAALVFWPRRNTIHIASAAGSYELVDYISDYWQKTLEENLPQDQMRDLADSMLDELRNGRQYALSHDLSKKQKNVLQILIHNISEEKIPLFLTEIVFPNYNQGFNKVLTNLAKQLPAKDLAPDLLEFINDKLPKQLDDFVALTEGIYLELVGNNKPPDTMHPQWDETLQKIVSAVIEMIPSIETKPNHGFLQSPKPLTQATLVQLFSLASKLKMNNELEIISAVIIRKEDLVSPDSALPTMLQKLKELKHSDKVFTKVLAGLWHHSARFLLARSSIPPAEPTDWKLPTVNKSGYYKESKKLREFCLSPTARELHITAVQDIRHRLEEAIKSENLDIDFHTVTETKPYTLVCTKNRTTYKRQLGQYDDDIKTMQLLLKEAKGLPVSTEVTEALQTAVKSAPST